jgi:4-oxalocrotonate tautomerase
MPIITVKVFQDELTEAQTAKLIGDITNAVIPFVGEALRNNTWVLVEEVKSGYWGIGGKAVGLSICEGSRRAPRITSGVVETQHDDGQIRPLLRRRGAD